MVASVIVVILLFCQLVALQFILLSSIRQERMLEYMVAEMRISKEAMRTRRIVGS